MDHHKYGSSLFTLCALQCHLTCQDDIKVEEQYKVEVLLLMYIFPVECFAVCDLVIKSEGCDFVPLDNRLCLT